MRFGGGSADGGFIEDRRGGFGGGGLALGGGGVLGIVGLIATLLFGGNPFGGGGGGLGIDSPGLGGRSAAPAGGSDLAGQSCAANSGGRGRVDVFVACAFNDAQRTWQDLFAREGERYRPATFVLYTGQTSTGCGVGSSAAGPFYCPADEKVYLDLSFFQQMRDQLGAPGDFAQAYVVAHEVGHHVQKVLGTSDQVRRAQQGDRERANEYSVRLELQADCYAGVWAHASQASGAITLEAGDAEEAINAAEQIGDDRLQRNAGRRVDPESFTHGTSAQRMRWFGRGLQQGDPAACNTFKGSI